MRRLRSLKSRAAESEGWQLGRSVVWQPARPAARSNERKGAPMSTDKIQTSIQGGVLEIRIARPETKNSLLVAMYQAMTDALRSAETDAAVRVVHIRGTGGEFTSGNDLRDFLDHPPVGPESTVFRFMQTIAAFPKPIVA